MTRGGARHRLSIELVEPFQLPAARGGVPRRRWERFPSRLAAGAEAALRLLDRHGARATFLVDDWIAARHEAVVAEIARQGHEVACRWDPSDEALDPAASRDRLEAASGFVVHGAWLAPGAAGALTAARIADAGFAYVQGAATPDHAVRVLPAPGPRDRGEWLRLLPGAMVGGFVAGYARAEAPRDFSFRLWELDPEAERLAILSAGERVRAYRNLAHFPDRLRRLLDGAAFGTLGESLGLTGERVAAAPSRTAVAPAPAPETRLGEAVTVVVPCFNEAPGLAFLANTLGALDRGLGRRHPLAVVLVDDGSADGTWAEMERLFAADPRVRRVRHERNRGIGAAILTGIRAAETEVVAVIDCDCSYDPARIEDLLPLLGPDVALVTASPYHPLGGVEGVPEWRLALSRSASWLYRRVLRNKLATYTSCFRVGRRSVLTGLTLRHEGYIGVVEMLARLDLDGRRVVEHPVVLEARLLGHSKIRILRVIAGHLLFIGEIIVTRRRRAHARPAAHATS